MSRRRPAPKATPFAINTGGDDSVYETLDGDYDVAVAHYQVPRPSVSYNARTEEVHLLEKKVEPFYHVLGPEAGNEYDYCGPNMENDVFETSFKTDLGGASEYADPVPVKHRVSGYAYPG